jgi:cytochrome c oxidase assembly protein subunit 15
MNGADTIAPGVQTPGAMSLPASPARRRFSAFVAVFALFVIFAGAQVKSHQAGLAVPDWPLSYGQWMPPMVGNIFYEHGHRIVAFTVGLLTVLLATWTSLAESRRGVRALAWACLAAVLAQGLLGGLTVLHLLPPGLSVSHAVLAQTYFCLVASVAFAVSLEGSRAVPRVAASGVVRAAFLAAAAVWVQLLLGAIMRHNEAGLAVPFFPVDADGRFVPAAVDQRVVLHLLHRGFALVVLPLVLVAAVRVARALPRLALHAALTALLVLGQIALGASVIWTARLSEADNITPVVSPLPASLHVVNGAALLAASWLLFLRVRHAAAPEAAR